MAIKRVTALTIKNQYPENIHIEGFEDTAVKKWSVRVYLKKDRMIHTLLLSSPAAFLHRGAAEEHARTVCESIVKDKSL